MNTKSLITALTVGVAVGAIVYFYAEKKYSKIAQDEIDSVKKAFSYRNDDILTEDDASNNEVASIDTKADKKEYSEKIKTFGYNIHSDKFDKKETPYIISPNEFAELDDYETISLYYYGDGILANGDDEPVENADEIVGLDFFSHFGEYEDDSVYVRNDALKCDFEILFDHHRFSEVKNKNSNPYLRKDD